MLDPPRAGHMRRDQDRDDVIAIDFLPQAAPVADQVGREPRDPLRHERRKTDLILKDLVEVCAAGAVVRIDLVCGGLLPGGARQTLLENPLVRGDDENAPGHTEESTDGVECGDHFVRSASVQLVHEDDEPRGLRPGDQPLEDLLELFVAVGLRGGSIDLQCLVREGDECGQQRCGEQPGSYRRLTQAREVGTVPAALQERDKRHDSDENRRQCKGQSGEDPEDLEDLAGRNLDVGARVPGVQGVVEQVVVDAQFACDGGDEIATKGCLGVFECVETGETDAVAALDRLAQQIADSALTRTPRPVQSDIRPFRDGPHQFGELHCDLFVRQAVALRASDFPVVDEVAWYEQSLRVGLDHAAKYSPPLNPRLSSCTPGPTARGEYVARRAEGPTAYSSGSSSPRAGLFLRDSST